MDKRSIVINVLGRQFPASVDEEEAAVIEKAEQSINAKIRAFKAAYKTQDDLDIAIMCCLEIMTEFLTHQMKAERHLQTALKQLSLLEKKLDTSPFAEGK
ncbi:MAG: cell division protein ZapA [Bacteroidia bacterium]|nr:cell division protein ZapA [Bacteroidia bacterium]